MISRINNTLSKLTLMLVSIGCTSQNNDPLKEVKFGTMDYLAFIKQFEDNKIFVDKDSKEYRYYLFAHDRTYPVTVKPQTDDFLFGKIRRLRISLGGDTTYFKWGDTTILKYKRGNGRRLKSEVQNIFNTYVQWYGQPDSSKIKTKYGTDAYVWATDKFKVSFHFPLEPTDPFGQFKSKDTLYYEYGNPFLEYEMYEYSKALAHLKDSVRRTLKPSDVASIEFSRPKWYPDGEYSIISIPIQRVYRNDNDVINEKLKAIKFDIVFSDKFGEEIYRVEDAIYEFSEPITAFWENRPTGSYEVRYNLFSSSPKTRALEKAKALHQSRQLVILPDIIALSFTDNFLLKKE